jgi:hypothetical protein
MNTIPSSLVRFESELERAIRKQRGRRSQRLALRTALVGAAAAAVVLGVFSALPGADPSVVERATAALTASDGTILHVVMTGTAKSLDGREVPMRVESWQASSAPFDRRDITTVNGRRQESAVVNGLVQLYDPSTNTAYVSQLRKHATDGGSHEKPDASTHHQANPPAKRGAADSYRTKIMALLGSGTAHEAGHVTVAGRDAIRIVSDHDGLELTVDASTYDPIEWRVTKGGRTLRVSFPVFERLPATAASIGLTSVTAQHPDARIDTDPDHFEAAAQRLEVERAW